MRPWREISMWLAIGLAVLIAIYGAASLALQRDGLLAIGTASASRLQADYSTDDEPPLLPPLDAGILQEIVEDEEHLAPRADDSSGVGGGNAATATPIPDDGHEPPAHPSNGDKATPPPAPTVTPHHKPTETPRPEPTRTPAPDPTDTPAPEPTATREPEPTDTPTATKTPRRCATAVIELPPIPGDDDECSHKTPTATPTPKKEPTATSIIDDVAECLLNPLECL